MRIPKHSVRWLLAVVGLVTVWLFIYHPFEVVSGIAGVLFLITAWHLIFGPHRSAERKGKIARSGTLLGLNQNRCSSLAGNGSRDLDASISTPTSSNA